MEFGRAVDLIEQLKQQVEIHGEDLRVGLYVDQETVETASGSVCGPVRLDAVEKTAPPRLDLTFMVGNN